MVVGSIQLGVAEGSVSKYPIVLVCIIYTFLFSLFIVTLFIYHTFLLLTNHTTLEHLKHNFHHFHHRSVYGKSSRCANFVKRLCYSWRNHPSHIVPSMTTISKRKLNGEGLKEIAGGVVGEQEIGMQLREFKRDAETGRLPTRDQSLNESGRAEMKLSQS